MAARTMRALLAGAALLGPIGRLQGQAPPPEPGARLRVTVVSPRLQTHVGTWRGSTDSTLQLEAGGPALTISLHSVRAIEQSRGRKPSMVGGIVGLLLGAAGGGALGCLANRDDYGVFCGGQSDTKVVVGATIGAAGGAVLGAMLFRRERWVPVDRAALRE